MSEDLTWDDGSLVSGCEMTPLLKTIRKPLLKLKQE